jgi:hypothetical protein
VPDQPQPRRRTTDRERRSWPDARLNDLKDDFEDLQAEQRALAALYRKLAPVPDLLAQYMTATDRRLDRMHDTLEKLRDENREQHRRVAYGVDPQDGKTPLPPQPATLTWGAVLKILTLFGVFFTAVSTIVAAVLAVLGAHP